MGIHYCDFLWGILMGKSYWDILWGFLIGISNGLGWEDWARKAGLGRPGQGWPGLAWDVMGFQSTVENPDKISP